MVKYKQQVQDMIEWNKELFTQFRQVHDRYILNPKEVQEEFTEIGMKVMPIVKRFENNLCAKSESGRYGKFSSNLSDKFWGEVRAIFPKIDFIGYQQG